MEKLLKELRVLLKMLFNSYEFIYLFFPLVFFSYWASTRYGHVFPKIVLCIGSVFFYCFMALSYLPLMLVSIFINYVVGIRIRKNRSSNWLTLGILFNLGLILFYKYFDFLFVDTLGIINEHLNAIIPLGISFYTFTQIAYLIDSYRGKTASNNSLTNYFLFVTYFPHLIAGPILHHHDMISQFSDKARYLVNYKNIYTGIIFFIIGLSKKVLIADSLIPYAAPVFKAVSYGEVLTPLECWCGAIAYTFQLYFDFSGYSDMAIGLFKFFNFDLPFNFNSPYKAQSISDFWRRWHMSLSSFLREYLYIPIGGNRKGNFRHYLNLLITMLIGGLWHGANWTFVVWGGYHGALLVMNHVLCGVTKNIIPDQVKHATTFFLVAVGWVIFRSESIAAAIKYYKYMLNFQDYLLLPEGWLKLAKFLPITLKTSEMPYFFGKSELFYLACLMVVSAYGLNSQEIVVKLLFLNERWKKLTVFIFIFYLFMLCLYNADGQSEFIYFQF